MANVTRRRQLVLEDAELDFSVSLDVNEYLIENWPTLTFANRRSVWSMADNDENFDWSSIEYQLDEKVEELAASDPNVDVNLGEVDEGVEVDDDYEEEFTQALLEYLSSAWDDWDNVEDDIDDLAPIIIDKITEAVDEYYDEDESEPTS